MAHPPCWPPPRLVTCCQHRRELSKAMTRLLLAPPGAMTRLHTPENGTHLCIAQARSPGGNPLPHPPDTARRSWVSDPMLSPRSSKGAARLSCTLLRSPRAWSPATPPPATATSAHSAQTLTRTRKRGAPSRARATGASSKSLLRIVMAVPFQSLVARLEASCPMRGGDIRPHVVGCAGASVRIRLCLAPGTCSSRRPDGGSPTSVSSPPWRWRATS